MIPTRKHIAYFMTLCEYKNITTAANNLYITQPALSRFLTSLEKDLGYKLFIRNRPMELTPEGKIFRTYLQDILELEWNQQQKIITLQGHERYRHFDIGTLPFLGSYILPRLLPQFSQENPDIHLDVIEVNGRFLEQILNRKEIDISLSNLPPESNMLLYKTLAVDPLIIVAPHDAEEDIDIQVTDYSIFNGKRFILLKPWQNIRKVADKVLASEQVTPSEIIEVQSISASLSIMTNQGGYAFTTLSSIEFIRPNIHLKKYYLGEYSNLTGIVIQYLPSTDKELLDSFCNSATKTLSQQENFQEQSLV